VPQRSTSLLRRILPADTRDDVLADLEELYLRRAARVGAVKARLWYRAQVLSYATRFGAERVRSLFRRDAGPFGRDPAARGSSRLFAISWLDWKLGGACC
jgi:hypothetical protein